MWKRSQKALDKNQRVSIPLPGFINVKVSTPGYLSLRMLWVSIPLPGFINVKVCGVRNSRSMGRQRFQSRCRDSLMWKISAANSSYIESQTFQSRCRDSLMWKDSRWLACCSILLFQSRCRDSLMWKIIASVDMELKLSFQSRCRDSLMWKNEDSRPVESREVSIPLPGFINVKVAQALNQLPLSQSVFQSRCRDSLMWKSTEWATRDFEAMVSIPLPGFINVKVPTH